jgi:sigma-B regulation protein RsbU (phosphoserine phosphatase)
MANNYDSETERLKQAVKDLSVLNLISGAINVLMSVEDISGVIIDHCIKRIGASQGSIFLSEDDEPADKFKTFIRKFSADEEEIPFHLSQSLSGWMVKNKAILMSNDPDNDKKLGGIKFAALGINSILATPLIAHGRVIGCLALFNKKDEGNFTDSDKRFLGIVGTQTAKVVESASLYEKEQKLAAMEEEVKIAQQIQKGFLPQQGIKCAFCEVEGINIPAREMGGDYYDMVELPDKRFFLSLGDVSGKGIPAALIMANSQAVLRSGLPASGKLPLLEMADSLNRLVCQFTRAGQFITTIFGELSCEEKLFRYINAGHMPPIVMRKDGQVIMPDRSDLVIGVVPDLTYNLNEIEMSEGDLVLLYTDGVTETFNNENEEYGEDRLLAFLKNNRDEELSVIGKKLLEELNSFRADAVRTDDITMLLMRICGCKE